MDTFFIVHLGMTATEIRRISLRIFSLFLSINLHRRCSVSKFFGILTLMCRKLNSDLKNALTKHFPKMQPFANVLQQNRCSYKFSDIHKKMSVLESLFSKVTDLMACNFIKKRPQHRCFPVNITKCLRIAFFLEYLQWLLLTMVAKFLRISNLTRGIFEHLR